MQENHELINSLALKAIKISGEQFQEIERCCWIAVHEHLHGVRPVEYDVREIDEDIFLSVLQKAKNKINTLKSNSI